MTENPLGKKTISLYYQYSPALSDVFLSIPALKKGARNILKTLIPILEGVMKNRDTKQQNNYISILPENAFISTRILSCISSPLLEQYVLQKHQMRMTYLRAAVIHPDRSHIHTRITSDGEHTMRSSLNAKVMPSCN